MAPLHFIAVPLPFILCLSFFFVVVAFFCLFSLVFFGSATADAVVCRPSILERCILKVSTSSVAVGTDEMDSKRSARVVVVVSYS